MIPDILAEDDLQPGSVDSMLCEHGGLLVTLANAETLCEPVLAAARSFFMLPPEDKTALAITRSGCFRGWSEMRNERDWREQLHLGRERSPGGNAPAFRQLEGPNLWPASAAWRHVISAYVERAANLGERILRAIASALEVDPARFGDVARNGYLVAKLIGYHPQPTAGFSRTGVAAHVDFSWLTLTLQDSDGLEVRRPDGTWTRVTVRPGTVWIHAGELLQHATRGRYQATPHRVLNHSFTHTRVSIPVFINPPLDAWVPVFEDGEARIDELGGGIGDHVHRVLASDIGHTAFHFGEAEWRRKGLGYWCRTCCTPTPDASAAD